MQSLITSFVFWTIALSFAANKANKNKFLEGRTYKLHLFFAWLLLMLHATGFKMLGWAVSNQELVVERYYKTIGPIPAWLNISSWVANMLFCIVAIIVAFSLINRKVSARQWVLRLIPILYLLAVMETIKGFYIEDTNSTIPLLIPFAIGAITFAIPFIAIYLFYRRKRVKEEIFE